MPWILDSISTLYIVAGLSNVEKVKVGGKSLGANWLDLRMKASNRNVA